MRSGQPSPYSESLAPPPEILTIQEAQLRALLVALQAEGGNVVRAAARLGVARRTIYNWLSKAGLHLQPPARQLSPMPPEDGHA